MSDQQPKKKPVRPGNWSNQFARFSHLVVINSPGMRVIKTMLAILLCLLIDYLRRNPTPVNATIAAVVCLQNDLRSTFLISLNRALGTLLAGLYSYIFILVFIRYFGMNPDSFLYYLLVGVCSLPLMHLMVRTHMPGAVAISAIVYVLICVSGNTASPLEYTVMRMIDTFVGIAVALFVNWLPPLNELGKRLKKVQFMWAQSWNGTCMILSEEEGRRATDRLFCCFFPSSGRSGRTDAAELTEHVGR